MCSLAAADRARLRGLLLALALVAAFATGLAIAAPGQAVAKPAVTKVSIYGYPKGVFGYVESARAGRCAEGRKILVFRRSSPASGRPDRRVATVRADRGPRAYQWSAKTGPGSFYARAATVPGCAAARSGVEAGGAVLAGIAEDRSDYPECSAYVSEGPTYVCRFPEMHVALDQQSPLVACSFSRSRGDCEGRGRTGPVPWGEDTYGGYPKAKLFWNGTSVTYVSYRSDQGNVGTAFLSGTVPAPGSPRFSISDAFAQNDRGVEQGDHFFTPDLPGQAAGQPGGPLYFRFVAGSGSLGLDADVYIAGYLYLRR